MDNNRKQQAFDWIEDNRQNLSDWHQIIWHLAEPAWREYKSCAWYVDKLREEGFEVEEGSGGMPTAFAARWRNGDGPAIGAYAEYDAVPGNCQAAATQKAPFLEACEKLISPQEAEEQLRREMPAWQKNWTSDDYVEMSWHTPTVRLYIARPMLKLPAGSSGYPDWVANALGGLRDCIDPTIVTAAKTIAATIIDLLTDAKAIKKVRDEFIDRTGGGIGGAKWIPPLLPKDFEAPVNYPWPEYIQTARGEDWLTPYSEDY